MSEENNKDLSAFMLKASENNISITINGKFCTMNAFFSMKYLDKLFTLYNECANYRMAFARIVYEMYTKTDGGVSTNSEVLNEQDFISATDKELSVIISYILGEDDTIRHEYDKLDCDNIFERFYTAHKNIVDGAISGIEKRFIKHQAQINRFMSPHLLAVEKQANRISQALRWTQLNPEITETMKFSSDLKLSQIDNAFTKIATQQAELSHIMTPSLPEGIVNLQSALQPLAKSTARIMSAIECSGLSNAVSAMSNTYKHTQLGIFNMTAGLQSLVDNIPRLEFDFSKIVAPLIDPLQEMGDIFTDRLQIPLKLLGQSLANIDFSLLTYHSEWDEKHDLLLSYGWFYLNELPKELIDDIYERQEELNVEEVNALIVAYFRSDRCTALKQVVNSWKKSRYFAPRNTVFHEALVNHSRRCYNASVTLTTLHTEGVITDFVRMTFKNPKFRAEKALSDIHSYIDDMTCSTLKFSDWQIFDSVITEIQAVLTESFDLANPDAASNNSRHKIAHGHAVDKETEEASLKRFLYLNELFRMFSVLDKEIGNM